VLPPVKAYSLNGSFSSLPEWYQDFLTGELDAFQKISLEKGRQAGNKNAAKWDFLLSYDEKKVSHRYRPDTFLLNGIFFSLMMKKRCHTDIGRTPFC